MTARQLAEALGLHPRAIPDFLDALVALQLLDREGDGRDAVYRNTAAARPFSTEEPAYIGGILEMPNARLYRFWGDLTEALRTGQPQNEIKHAGKSMFEELYSDPARLEQFMDAMTGISAGNFQALAEKFDFSRYKTLCDVGRRDRAAVVHRGRSAPAPALHVSFDLPAVEPIAERTIAAAGLQRPRRRPRPATSSPTRCRRPT